MSRVKRARVSVCGRVSVRVRVRFSFRVQGLG